MKKVLGILVLSLLLSGCGDSSSSKIYLKCTTIEEGAYVTMSYGTKVGDIKYYEINIKKKLAQTIWDSYNKEFTSARRLDSVGEKYIKIKHYRDNGTAKIDRETGKMTHRRVDPFQSDQTPVAMCQKISKKDLPITKTKKKF